MQVTRKRKRTVARDRTLQRRWQKIMDVSPDNRFSLLAVERHAMSCHLASRMQRNRTYSLPVSVPLRAYMGHRSEVNAVDALGLEADAPPTTTQELLPHCLRTKTFVKVVASQMTRYRLGPVPLASTKLLKASDLCVSVHAVWDLSHDGEHVQPVVQIEPSRVQSIGDHLALLNVCSADIETLKEQMESWSTKQDLVYLLPALRTEEQELVGHALRRLLANNAFIGRDTALHITATQTDLLIPLQLLQRHGYVVASEEDMPSSTWRPNKHHEI
eukprot:6478771-Amphidinium_carterae.3